MHLEVEIALNFLLSFLYNKLPRRRVHQFGEELDKAIKIKFQNHWYTEQPSKGSAYRCLKTASPIDPILEWACLEAGIQLTDIKEILPDELSIWIDPGEVSYRLSERSPIKIIYSTRNPVGQDQQQLQQTILEQSCNNNINDYRLLSSTGVESDSSVLNGPAPSRSLLFQSASFSGQGNQNSSLGPSLSNMRMVSRNDSFSSSSSMGSTSSALLLGPTPFRSTNQSGYTFYAPNNQQTSHIDQPLSNNKQQPLVFTAAMFAQTKFGSTKLKNQGGHGYHPVIGINQSPTGNINHAHHNQLKTPSNRQLLSANQSFGQSLMRSPT